MHSEDWQIPTEQHCVMVATMTLCWDDGVAQPHVTIYFTDIASRLPAGPWLGRPGWGALAGAGIVVKTWTEMHTTSVKSGPVS